jgi:hypothetical protein
MMSARGSFKAFDWIGIRETRDLAAMRDLSAYDCSQLTTQGLMTYR